MRYGHLLLMLGAAMGVSGCSTVAGGPPRMASRLESDDKLSALKSTIKEDCFDIPSNTTTIARRNGLVTAYMLVVDQQYDIFEAAMLEEGRVGNFVATITSLGLATAGGLASGKTAKVLSAANVGVIGEREAFNKEFLFSLTVPALQNQMRASRATVRTRIYERMTQSPDVWPTCVALQDVEAYEQAGTLVGALVGINETTAEKKKAAEAQSQAAIPHFRFDTGKVATALRDYFNPQDQDLQRARIARGKGPAMTVANLSKPTDMTDDEFFGRLLADPAFAKQQQALLLGLIASETDPGARAGLLAALKD